MDPFYLGPLAVWHHPTPRPARARLLLIHGISEHSGRHLNTIEALGDRAIEVVRFDLQGAGLSGGPRQWVARFGDYVLDAARVLNWIHRTLPPLPLFLLGHSLGGAIATHFTADYGRELRGLLLSAPAFRVGPGIPPLKIAVGRVLYRLAPAMRLADHSDNHAISRDPAVVSAYRSDPLCCHFNTVQQGFEVLRALDEMPARAGEINVPVVFFHGSADAIIRLEGSFELLKIMPSRDKTMHILPGGYHESHNDLDKADYFSLMGHWLDHELTR